MGAATSAPLTFALAGLPWPFILVRTWTLLCVLPVVRRTEGTLPCLVRYFVPALSFALGACTHEWETLSGVEVLSLTASILGPTLAPIPHDLLPFLRSTQGITCPGLRELDCVNDCHGVTLWVTPWATSRRGRVCRWSSGM